MKIEYLLLIYWRNLPLRLIVLVCLLWPAFGWLGFWLGFLVRSLRGLGGLGFLGCLGGLVWVVILVGLGLVVEVVTMRWVSSSNMPTLVKDSISSYSGISSIDYSNKLLKQPLHSHILLILISSITYILFQPINLAFSTTCRVNKIWWMDIFIINKFK